jgi:hypothetical protein
MSPPVSLQPTSNDPKEIGYVELTGTLRRVRLTNPAHVQADLLGTTVEGAGTKPCTDTLMTAAVRVFPPLSQQPATLLGDPASNTPTDSGCEYYQKTANYLRTGAPYTTGMAQNWEPLGGFSTKNTETGYDNRTAGGLNGRISMVAPRLLHVYTRDPESIGGEANLTWSSTRMRRIDFVFIPEPMGVAMLAAGFVTLAGLHRLRRR